jgi:hypothetical protein
MTVARQELAKHGKQAMEALEPPTSTCHHSWKKDDEGFRWAVFQCIHCAMQCYTKGQHPDDVPLRAQR